MYTTDILICGGGIIGLTLARRLLQEGAKDIIILEKEPDLGKHASGRNSGVLHAGIYYDPGTMKAKMCFKGNRAMRQYCLENDLPIFESGKVIVARDESELPTLHELHRRATANGATTEIIDMQQLAELEPNAKSAGQALYSPLTAVVDPKPILQHMRKELESMGNVRFFFNTRFLDNLEGGLARTTQGDISYGLFINCAGAFSDKIAHKFAVGRQYRLIPFKGIYKTLRRPAADLIKGSIYPVPNIKNPFLGVHFTRSVHGDVYLGPTAIPAFGRENYGILSGIDGEVFTIMARDAKLFLVNKKFRDVALIEPRKYIFKFFFEDARKLVKELNPGDIKTSPKSGIRPQLVDMATNELVMDFTVKPGHKSLHVLNSISPAFTSAFAFADMVVDEHLKTVV